MLFAMLLLYATTADFVATTVGVITGHDCDHPWVRIEHKCVTSSVRTHSHDRDANQAPAPVALMTVAVSPGESEQVLHAQPARVEYAVSDTRPNSLPLLC